MIYADLPAGATVFLDASVFIHHFEPNVLFGPAATEFLERIENQEISGITGTHIPYLFVLAASLHRSHTFNATTAQSCKDSRGRDATLSIGSTYVVATAPDTRQRGRAERVVCSGAKVGMKSPRQSTWRNGDANPRNHTPVGWSACRVKNPWHSVEYQGFNVSQKQSAATPAP